MSNHSTHTASEQHIDYSALAIELRDVKREMIHIQKLRGIVHFTNGENYVLGLLAQKQHPLHPKEISDAMCISTARVAKILNQLEEKKYIERSCDPNNKRQKWIALLPAGLAQNTLNIEAYIQRLTNFLRALGPEDAYDYVRIQKKIVTIYGNVK
ncbi:MarR family transcriptional regulator [Fusibacter paucivorans]|uniref:MarR family transcriptional regulator n=1 Tax=Fusibacter paucivorans TaxID=76009 RepID=A0ABS5PK77_9FIRM|nr:MarR family transcriptional regulator [Fusibacter paucivorans]MBS7525232.1 MarR family transcriptional regulator [Fusibacter paucivorans]